MKKTNRNTPNGAANGKNRPKTYYLYALAICAAAIAALAISISGCGDNSPNGNQSDELDAFLNKFSKDPGQNNDTTATTPVTPTTHTLTVNVLPAEGGIVSRDIERSSYEAGTPVTVTATAKTGYEFLGWSGASNSKEPTVTIEMDGNKTLSAGFQRIGANLPKYTVYFNANGATGTPPEAIQRDSASVVSLPDRAGLTKEWHSFAGWNTEANGNGKSYNEFDDYTVINIATLFAQWTRDTYTLTVNTAAGGTTSRSSNQAKYDAGTQVTVIAAPDEHFTFSSWSGASSATNTTVTIIMDGNKELTPIFTQNKYTLTTNISPESGGSVSRNPNANSYSPGTEVTVTATAATAQGYTFSGWSGASTATTATVTITMDGNKTLTAMFGKADAKKFTVTFNKNGAATGDVQAVTVDSGVTITLPDQGNLERNGYSLGVWNTNIAGTGTDYPANSPYTVKNNITLYAKWTPINYTITYTLNNGTVTSANPVSYSVETATFTLNNPTRLGYTFAGWTGSNGTSPQTSVSVAPGSTGNKSYTANWTPITYTITYTLNDGIVTSANPASYTIETPTFTLNNPNRTGYAFTGWTETNGATPQTSVSVALGSTGNKSYSANWVIVNYGITYTFNGGSVSTANTASYNIETVSFTLNNPTRDGYTFSGWTGSNGTTAQTAVTVGKGSTGDKSYTANWAVVNYGISYTLNGGSVSAANPVSYNIETASFTLNNPNRDGYTFSGWTGSNGTTAQTAATVAKGSTGNKNYTANWTITTYTLTTAANPSGYGSFSRSPNQTNYDYGTNVQVTATAVTGYTFTGWSGDASGTANPVTVTMDKNKTVTANFVLAPAGVPSGVTATAVSTGSIAVSWPTVPGTVTGYRVYRSTSSTGTYVSRTETPYTSYTDTCLSLGTTYYYKVSAYNVGGEGSQSSSASATTASGIPSGVTATALSSSAITMNWSSISDARIYYVYRSTSLYGTYSWLTSTSSTSYTDTYLSSGTTYYYTVSANYCAGESSQSAVASAITFPDVPSGVSATQDALTSITVKWSPASGVVTGYRVYRSTSATGTYTLQTSISSSSYTNTGLSSMASTTYYYKISAYNDGGESPLSPYISSRMTFSDARDGKTYKTTSIKNKIWMAEDLNYTTSSGSWCYSDNTSNCNTYGRRYNWSAASTACPSGWHLPSRREWGDLANAAGGGTGDYGKDADDRKLKATSGWSDRNGTDDYGFSAKPGGYYSAANSKWDNIGKWDVWWTATSEGSNYYVRNMRGDRDGIFEETNPTGYRHGVRCVRDN